MHIQPLPARQLLKIGAFGALCMAAAFAIGIQSAGEVQPITLIEAGSPNLSGDMDGNGIVDVQDAIRVIEVVQGYRAITPDLLLADPNGDGALTLDDALRILRTLP